MSSTTNIESKGFSPIFQQASNLRTREQWLHAVLHSGRVSRIGQHLALVIYHLADVATNIAKLSARDLERITGWSRTAIAEHVNELHRLGEFLRVQWGQGRAKSIFELQGVIAGVMAQKKAERDAATTIATTADTTSSGNLADATAGTKPDTNVMASQLVATADATADTTVVASHADATDHRCVRHADANLEKSPEGGTIGGESNKTQDLSLSHSLCAQAREKAEPPDWMISEDGGFEGQVFELSGVEVGALATTYSYLEFPADLVGVDQFLARQFSQLEHSPPIKDRLARMHTYLAKRNREAREMRLAMGLLSGKPQPRKQAAHAVPAEPPSCWFDDDARLQVANGFKAELLDAVGGDEIRLREELNEAGGWVGVQVRGPQLIAKVRSQINRQIKGQTKARVGTGLARSGISDRDELTKALRRIEAETDNKREGNRYGN